MSFGVVALFLLCKIGAELERTNIHEHALWKGRVALCLKYHCQSRCSEWFLARQHRFSSTSKSSVALGGMVGGAPRLP